MFGKRKWVKKTVLKDIDIELVSMLFDGVKPANDKGFVVKSGDKSYELQGVITKFKSDIERQGVCDFAGARLEGFAGRIVSKRRLKPCDRFAQKGIRCGKTMLITICRRSMMFTLRKITF